jgi:hypothetical protein
MTRVGACLLFAALACMAGEGHAQAPGSPLWRAVARLDWGDSVRVTAERSTWVGILQRQRADTLFIVSHAQPVVPVLRNTIDSLWVAERNNNGAVTVTSAVGFVIGAAAGIGLTNIVASMAGGSPPSGGDYVMPALIGGVVVGFLGGALGSLVGPAPRSWKRLYPRQ